MTTLDSYQYIIFWSDDDQIFRGRVTEFPSLGAHGDTPDEALAQIKKAVQGAIELMQEKGYPVPAPIRNDR